MKTHNSKYMLLTAISLAVCSCHKLDLKPLTQGSTDTWYSNSEELRMAVNIGYGQDFLYMDGDPIYGQDDWSDDNMTRNLDLSGFTNGTLTSSNYYVANKWQRDYKLITRMNAIINKAERALNNGSDENKVARYVGEAHFFSRTCIRRLDISLGRCSILYV